MRSSIAVVTLALVSLSGCRDGSAADARPRPIKPGACPIEDGVFVRAEGTALMVGDEPFRFVGANAAIVHGARAREEAPRLLEAMRADGVRVVRIWALGEADDDGQAWRRDYAFRLGPEGWVEESFVHLDRVLAKARELDLRVILVLANRWGDYGGLTQYARWAGIEAQRKHLLHAELGAALRSERVRALYRAHIERLAGRVNTVTGVPYRDDPTIFAWELANELTTGTCATADAVRAFVAEMSAYLRRLDPNHLVSAGHTGYKSALSRETWRDVIALPDVGYADHHAYPEHLYELADPDDLAPWVADRAHLACNVLDKPLVVGEIGYARGDERFAPRAEWLSASFRLVDEAGIAGMMPWIYRSWEERDDRHGIWAWGPHAAETSDVRAVLKWWSSRWAGERPTIEVPAIREAAPTAALQEADLHLVAPYTEGTWEAVGADRWRVSVFPWALAEGCAREGEEAWAEYVLLMPRAGTPGAMDVRRIGVPADGGGPLGIDVAIDGIHVGTFDGAGGFTASDEDALADAFAVGGTVRWLRLSSRTERGAAVLRRFTAELPSGDPDDVLSLAFGY